MLNDIFILFNATPTESGRLAYTDDIPGIHLWSWGVWLSPAAQNSVFECPLLRRLKKVITSALFAKVTVP